MSDNTKVTDEEALAYHLEPTPGKIAIVASTPMATQRDLSLAYSPGVAAPVQAIADDPALVNERILLDIQTVWYEEMTDL